MSDEPWIEPKNSSVVAAYRYRADELRLDVRLRWGETRSYKGVTATAFRFFKGSPTLGSHLLRVIDPVTKYDDLGRWK